MPQGSGWSRVITSLCDPRDTLECIPSSAARHQQHLHLSGEINAAGRPAATISMISMNPLNKCNLRSTCIHFQVMALVECSHIFGSPSYPSISACKQSETSDAWICAHPLKLSDFPVRTKACSRRNSCCRDTK